MRKPATLYEPILSLPLFIWQLLFFLAPLLFLTALSFWTVRNFRLEPDFSPENWEWMLGSGAFWDAYSPPFPLWPSAAAIPRISVFPLPFAFAFPFPDTARCGVFFLFKFVCASGRWKG